MTTVSKYYVKLCLRKVCACYPLLIATTQCASQQIGVSVCHLSHLHCLLGLHFGVAKITVDIQAVYCGLEVPIYIQSHYKYHFIAALSA